MRRSSSMAAMPPVQRRGSSRGEPESPGTRPSSRVSWKTFADDGSDIAAAMQSVKLAMKSKSIAREESDLQSRMQEVNRRIMQEAEESAAREAERLARREEQREKAAAALTAAMQKGNLKVLQKAIDHAVAKGVSSDFVSEARALWNLESRLQSALAAANLDKIRKAVADVERGRTLSALPREPPFAVKQPLEYWSERRGHWVDCYVTAVSADNKIQINLKKKASHWYNLGEQREKFRTTDADIAAAAPMVRLKEARALLGRADELENALLSEDVDRINTAVVRAGQDQALSAIVSRAQTFIQETQRAHAEAEASRRSGIAAAWHSARKNIHAALKAAANHACARSSRGGTGWDDLEKDLAIERIATLEHVFDSTDLAGLELALKQLESEDFEIPITVIEEAHTALCAIRRQHEELEQAMREGDIDAISSAIALASEHLMPEMLVCKARSVLEIAVTLDRAIKSRDPLLLASTLSQVESDSPCGSLLQRARGILHATEMLREALCNDDIDAMRMTMASVEEHLLPEKLVCNVKIAIALDVAIKSQDPEMLASALSQVEHHSIEMPLIRRAKSTLSAIEGLQLAVQGCDIDAIKKAIQNAEDEGILSHKVPLLASAHNTVNASRALEMAIQGDDADAISDAIKVAKTQGVPTTCVHKAEEMLARRVTVLMQAAAESGDIDALETALHNAEAYGLPVTLMDNFQQDLKKQRVHKATHAVEAAMHTSDVYAMSEAIRAAEVQGLPETLVQKFRQELEQQKVKKAADTMHAAMQSNDVNAMEEAIRAAEAQGLPETLIGQFHQELEEQKVKMATDAVQTAMQGDDQAAIEKAIQVAEAAGAPLTLVKGFRQQLADAIAQSAIDDVQAAMQGNDVDAIEKSIRVAESQGVAVAFIDKFRQELELQREKKQFEDRRAKVLATLEIVIQGDNLCALRLAIAEGEALGLESELEPARKALEEELSRRMAKALQERAQQEKLAAEFKSAKEAQDFGGGVLVAQWRAAVAEVAKPFEFSEEEVP